ncbi:hypothetical protein GCM10009414_13110 [Tatumella terrea]|uniref:hypothetical protein n=1 Tax=Tatumella terrea TaxID=419007 RepID=UPI0031D4807A
MNREKTDEYRALIVNNLPAVTTSGMTVDYSDEEVLQDTIEWEDIADLIGALSAMSAQSGLNLKLS